MAACKQFGWTDIPATVVNLAEIVRGEFAENTQHKDFLPSEAVAIARALEPGEREARRNVCRKAVGVATSHPLNPVMDLHRKSGELPSHLSRHTFALHRTDAAQI